jgi:hypothetical protein
MGLRKELTCPGMKNTFIRSPKTSDITQINSVKNGICSHLNQSKQKYSFLRKLLCL